MGARKTEFIVGRHAVRSLLAQRSHDVLSVFVLSGRPSSDRLGELLATCEGAAISVQSISRARLDRLTGTANHQGIAAECRLETSQNTMTIAELCAVTPAPATIVLALDRVMDPHNLGACIRTADAAGVSAVILTAGQSAPLNATVKKVASGAAEGVSIITVANLARSLRQLRDAGYWIIGATEDAGQTVYELNAAFPVVLVIGSEQAGLRRNTREHCDQLVKIPMYGSVESLNLSVATGVCLYELRRKGLCAGPTVLNDAALTS